MSPATLPGPGNPFEQRSRDIHTVSQQLQGRQEHFETVGQYLLGLEPDNLAWLCGSARLSAQEIEAKGHHRQSADACNPLAGGEQLFDQHKGGYRRHP
jgi:hypothetical protein